MDLNRAFSEAKSLPDDVLKTEMAKPSGMMPGWLAASELSERHAIRGGSYQKKPSIAQQIMQRASLMLPTPENNDWGIPQDVKREGTGQPVQQSQPGQYAPPAPPPSMPRYAQGGLVRGHTYDIFNPPKNVPNTQINPQAFLDVMRPQQSTVVPAISVPADFMTAGSLGDVHRSGNDHSYSEGGIVRATNPFLALTDSMQDPEAAGQQNTESLMDRNGGLLPLMAPKPPQPLGQTRNLSTLVPQQPGQLQGLGVFQR